MVTHIRDFNSFPFLLTYPPSSPNMLLMLPISTETICPQNFQSQFVFLSSSLYLPLCYLSIHLLIHLIKTSLSELLSPCFVSGENIKMNTYVLYPESQNFRGRKKCDQPIEY